MASESLISQLIPDDSTANRKRLSALHRATTTYPPTFLAIPQFDATVAPTQSWRFAEKLRSLGVEVETGRADGGGHCFDRQGGDLNQEGGQWWDGVTRPALDFLVRHLTAAR
jgi:acetyl esterase/lipase